MKKIKEKSKLKLGFALGIFSTMILSSVYVYATTVSKPHTFVDGQTISATEMNANFDTIYSVANLPTFVGKVSSDITFTTGTVATISIDNVVEDNSSAWNAGTYTYTIPVDGVYEIGAAGQCLVSCSNKTSFKAFINGSDAFNLGYTQSDSATLLEIQFKKLQLQANSTIVFQTDDTSMSAGETVKASTALFYIKKVN